MPRFHCAFKIALYRRRSIRCVGRCFFLCGRVRAAPWQATMAPGQPRDRQAAHAKDPPTRQNSAGRNEPDRAPFAREDQGRAQVPHPHAQSEKKERKRDPRAQCARARKQRGAWRALSLGVHVVIHMPACQETTLAHEECPLADQSTGGHAPLGPPSAAPLRPQQLAPASRFLSSTKSIRHIIMCVPSVAREDFRAPVAERAHTARGTM